MKTPLQDASNLSVWPFDVIVVGSGIAGTDIADFLSSRGWRVCVVESGGDDIEEKYLALNNVVMLGRPHRERNPEGDYQASVPDWLRGLNRVRAVGGTSALWTGKHSRFLPEDFEGQNPDSRSAWPIHYEELSPHYEAIERDYLNASLDADSTPRSIRKRNQIAAAHGLSLRTMFWDSEPLRAGPIITKAARTRKNLVLLTDATVTSLILDGAGEQITGVQVNGLLGHRTEIRAPRVVLAGGALENTRLLLLTAKQLPKSSLAKSRSLGKFYQDHLKHQTTTLVPGPKISHWSSVLARTPRPRFGVFFQLDHQTVSSLGINNAFLYLKPVTTQSRGRLVRRRNSLRYGVKIALEQEPNPASELRLARTRDVFGVPELEMDWQTLPIDERTLSESIRLFGEGLRGLGIGSLSSALARISLDDMTDSSHPMGTCRMSHYPEAGVVDPNLEVHGVRGLFVTGGAVFPRGPNYSPTLTILALARRLAVFLHNQRGEGACV